MNSHHYGMAFFYMVHVHKDGAQKDRDKEEKRICNVCSNLRLEASTTQLQQQTPCHAMQTHVL